MRIEAEDIPASRVFDEGDGPSVDDNGGESAKKTSR